MALVPLLALYLRSTQMPSILPCTLCGPWSCRPQPRRGLPRCSLSPGHKAGTWSAVKPCKPTLCVGCLLTPRREGPQVQRAPSLEPADTPQRTFLSQHATGCVAHGAQLQVAHGASSTSKGGDPRTGRSPRGRQCEHPSQGDHPQN